MDIIDVVKNLENVGFTRKQAEQQVKAMTDLKQDLMTKEDGQSMFQKLDQKIESLETKFDAKFESMEGQLKGIVSLLQAQDVKNSVAPMKNAVYMAGLLVIYVNLIPYWPSFKNWLLQLFK